MEEKTVQMIRRIAVTGPESTGKSMLAEQLAGHYGTVWVPEFARAYLDNLGRPYREEDIPEIARGQFRAEHDLAAIASGYLFCDTELLVTKIWSEVKYGRCHPWITETMALHPHDLYLLCDIDLPWEFDPLREHPDLRGYLFGLYRDELEARGWPYAVISGLGAQRLRNAIGVIEKFPF